MKKKRKKNPKDKISYWIKKLKPIFNRYVRLRDADKYGWCHCISCERKLFWKGLGGAQAGHFIPKARGNVFKFDETNVNVQCYNCNINLGGNLYAYGLGLDKKYGEGTAERLYKESFKTKKFTIEELQEMIKIYEKKAEELENKLI